MDADDLRDRIADMRRLRDAASPLPWMVIGTNGKCHVVGPVPAAKVSQWDDCQYIAAAANLAPALADAYDAALATIAERDAEIWRLRTELDVARARLAAKNIAPHISMTDDVKGHYLMVCAELVALRECINKWTADCAADALKGANDDGLDRLFRAAAKAKGFGPLTPEEAQAAYDAAEPVPISEERISEIVAHATKGANRDE